MKKYVKMMHESLKNHHTKISMMKFRQNKYKKIFDQVY